LGSLENEGLGSFTKRGRAPVGEWFQGMRVTKEKRCVIEQPNRKSKVSKKKVTFPENTRGGPCCIGARKRGIGRYEKKDSAEGGRPSEQQYQKKKKGKHTKKKKQRKRKKERKRQEKDKGDF